MCVVACRGPDVAHFVYDCSGPPVVGAHRLPLAAGTAQHCCGTQSGALHIDTAAAPPPPDGRCCGDAYHFDMSNQAFGKIADLSKGVVGIYYRQVSLRGREESC